MSIRQRLLKLEETYAAQTRWKLQYETNPEVIASTKAWLKQILEEIKTTERAA